MALRFLMAGVWRAGGLSPHGPNLFLVDGLDLLFFDVRGLFERFADPTGTVDPDGDTRAIGALQGDAIRNITGKLQHMVTDSNSISNDLGALDRGPAITSTGVRGGSNHIQDIFLNASNVVPTSIENRPKNFSGTYLHWPLG